MKTCRELKARGIGIVFVSHKLEELFELCDRVTVIRDGEYIETRDISGWDNDSPDHRDGRPFSGQPVPEGDRRKER